MCVTTNENTDLLIEEDSNTSTVVEQTVSIIKENNSPSVSVAFTLEELAMLLGPEPLSEEKVLDIIIHALGTWGDQEDP